MNGGYVLIDADGVDTATLPTTIPGFHNHIAEAVSSGKVCIVCGVKAEGSPASPSSVPILTVGKNFALLFNGSQIVVTSNDEVLIVS